MRILLKRVLLLVFLFSLILPPSSIWADANPIGQYIKPVEVRAVWMDRRSIPNTERDIRLLIRKYAKAGINLIFPEVIYNGYSAYPSRYLTEQNLWNGLDVLSVIVEESHRNRMEVHPWVWVFRAGYTADRGGILTNHPDWAAIDKDGRNVTSNGSYWLCPSIPDVRAFLLNAYKELVEKYNVDGIHLDYVRFQDQSDSASCYNESCKGQFMKEYGLDPLGIEAYTKPVISWHLWRERLVSSFVGQVSDELRKIRPGLKISAAVGCPYNTARIDLLQDWLNWADNKWVDFVVPMDYTSSADSFRRNLRQSPGLANAGAMIIPGIGVHLLNDERLVAEQVRISRFIPTNGVTLFASSYISGSLLDDLGRDVFPRYAALPFRNPVESAKRMQVSAMTRIRPSMSLYDLVYACLDAASARSLSRYANYRTADIGFVEPSPPPIFIPEIIQTLPEMSAFRADVPPVIDGHADDPVWRMAVPGRIWLTNIGALASQESAVRLAYDAANLYICITATEPLIGGLRASVVSHDGPVFQDDSIEVFLAPATKDQGYYHFAVNTIGAKFEQKSLDASWDGAWDGAASKDADSWTAELRIPFTSLGITSPSAGETWRANFCRNRYAGGSVENSCWSVTYGTFHTPARFGAIRF